MSTTPAAGLTGTQLSNPLHGTLTLNANGSFTYVHDGSETTSDTFSYKVCDNATSSLCSGTVMVSITVNPVNDAPFVTNDNSNGNIQYSDPITNVNITATDVDGPTFTLGQITYVYTADTAARSASVEWFAVGSLVFGRRRRHVDDCGEHERAQWDLPDHGSGERWWSAESTTPRRPSLLP
jgi:VCBS repeat-containing protein